MKYIKELLIDVDLFIKKDFFNKVKINELSIPQIHNSQPKEFKKIINQNLDDYKNYIKDNNPNDFKNINKYSEYYDFIAEKILDKEYLSIDNNKLVYDLTKLDPLFFKSSRYAFLYIKESLKNKKKLDPELIKKLEKTILQNFGNATIYAESVLNDRWEELESRIIDENDLEHFENYIIALIKIFKKHEDKKSEKFTEFYNKSNVFKKFINHDQTIRNGLSKFNFWNPIIDEILINKPELYLDYYNSVNDFNEDTSKMEQNIMKDPEKISLFYTDWGRSSGEKVLPEDPIKKQKIFNALSQYPNQLISFVYSRYNKDDSDIFKDFPNFINDAVNSNHIHLFSFLEKIFINKIKKITDIIYWDQYKISDYINDYKKQFKEVRDYMYKTYKPFIEKIGDDPFYSLKYANLTLYPFPFKEGEQKILNSMLHRRDYLYLIKMLGPSIVPNYNDYDLTSFNQGNHNQWKWLKIYLLNTFYF